MSHARAARAYTDVLSNLVEIVSTPIHADVVILHDEPHNFPRYYKTFPELAHRYVIAYSVWESTDLPEVYASAISLVQEIWTCSHYSQKAFSKHHKNVNVLPHLVSRVPEATEQDRAKIEDMIAYKASHPIFLAIGRLWDLRKNLRGLVTAFERTRLALPDARLIVKLGSSDLFGPPTLDSRVHAIRCHLSDNEVNALYSLSTAFVSAHHAEGWGFCISDALVLGTPVIATRYSGVLDYLSDENAVLISAKEVSIPAHEQYGLFTSHMKWGNPDLAELESAMLQVASHAGDRESNTYVQRGLELRERFSEASIAAHLKRLLKT